MALGHRHLLDFIYEKMNLSQESKILDIGCGVGDALKEVAKREKLPDSNLYGIDLSKEMIEKARQNIGAHFVVASAQALPFASDFFDQVFSIESLYYHTDYKRSLEECLRVLKPGGCYHCAIEFYSDNSGSKSWAQALGIDLHWLSTEDWLHAMRQAGFESVRASRISRDQAVDENFQESSYFPRKEDYESFLKEGSLYLSGSKKLS